MKKSEMFLKRKKNFCFRTDETDSGKKRIEFLLWMGYDVTKYVKEGGECIDLQCQYNGGERNTGKSYPC